MDTGNRLRHLAFVADGLAAAASPASAVEAAFGTAASLLPVALAAGAGEVEAVTFFAPEVRDLVLAGGAAAGVACAAGIARLTAAAAAAGSGFRLLGRRDRLPPGVRESSAPAPHAADGRVVGWFLDYGARDEILRAAGRITPGAPVDEGGFAGLLDTAGLPDPDLVLYVGGEFAPKDFLLWQASYAELWHTPTPWQRFTPADLGEALADFARRQRRFGA